MAQNIRLPEEAPWESCDGELNNAVATIGGNNVRVYVSGCNSTLTECKMPRGTNQTISTTFHTTSSSDRLERVIVAEFPRRIRGVKLEIPYGAAVNACPDTKKTVDSISCEQGGILANTDYTHASTFPVFANAPKAKLIVKYMLRKPMEGNPRITRRTNWKNQSGPYFVCVKIPVELI